MLRFILRRTTRDQGDVSTGLYTVDADVPSLERELIRGGYGGGPNGDDFERTAVFGVEVLPASPPVPSKEKD